MPSLSSVVLLVLGASAASAVLGGLVVAGLWWAWPRVERYFFERFAAYQADIERTRNALPVTVTRQLADAELAEYQAARDELKRIENMLEEQIDRRQHVLAGGEIDDSPRKWRKGQTK